MQLLVNEQVVVAYFMVLSRYFLKELTEAVPIHSQESLSAVQHIGHPNLNQQCYQLR
jgi:hypothetical protein